MPVLAIVGILLVAWVVVSILGFVIKGLLWLAIVGIGLFMVTAAIGWVRRKAIDR